MKVKIVKEVKKSDGLWRFACGDVSIWEIPLRERKKTRAREEGDSADEYCHLGETTFLFSSFKVAESL